MACTCPSGKTEVGDQIELRKYCEDDPCSSGGTSYSKVYWSAKQISCQDSKGNVENIACKVKLGCC